MILFHLERNQIFGPKKLIDFIVKNILLYSHVRFLSCLTQFITPISCTNNNSLYFILIFYSDYYDHLSTDQKLDNRDYSKETDLFRLS